MNKIKSYKNTLLTLSILSVCLLTLIYWLYSRGFVSTDDAYVNANVVQIASRVSGRVDKLLVKDHQFTTKDSLLIQLDPLPFEARVNQWRADLLINESKLTLAQLTYKRTQQLLAKNVASLQENDVNLANLRAADAAVALSKANLFQSRLDLRYTQITAPASGWVANLTLREGDMVTANQPLFALIDSSEFWVDANFKETQLSEIKPGQKATVVVDMYPDKTFEGIVESISGGSGNAFSLLPPENATGNWVKITQRIPVKVKIITLDQNFPLRIGSSATVTIKINR